MNRPLHDTFPQLLVLNLSNNAREYRVENIQSFNAQKSSFVFLLFAVLWYKHTPLFIGISSLLLIFLVYSEITHVLWESVIVSPRIGLRFETHKGPFGRAIFISRRSVALSDLSDVIINEGIRRWNILFYLAALVDNEEGSKIHVAYENLLPRFPILHYVYLEIHELLFTR